jgi:hypothetical protein
MDRAMSLELGWLTLHEDTTTVINGPLTGRHGLGVARCVCLCVQYLRSMASFATPLPAQSTVIFFLVYASEGHALIVHGIYFVLFAYPSPLL